MGNIQATGHVRISNKAIYIIYVARPLNNIIIKSSNTSKPRLSVLLGLWRLNETPAKTRNFEN